MKNIFLITLGLFTFFAVSCQTTKDLSTADSVTPTKQVNSKKKSTTSSYKAKKKKSSSNYSSPKKKSYIKPQSEEAILAKIDAQETFKPTVKAESSSSATLPKPKVPSIPSVPSISDITTTPITTTPSLPKATLSAPTPVYKSTPTAAPIIDLPRITSEAGSLDQNISLELRLSQVVK